MPSGGAGHHAQLSGRYGELPYQLVVRPLQEETVEQSRPLLRTLFLAVAVVLLIACVNLAGLMLVRAIRRQREIAVRLALGARTAALLRQTLLESLVLSVSGGLLGLALAGLALRVGKNLLPESLPRISEIALNWNVVGFALLLAVIRACCVGWLRHLLRSAPMSMAP